MALIVEDGTGLTNADSFISFADASTYLISRNKVSPAGSSFPTDQTTGEALLRQAADYMEGYYRFQWAGWKVTPYSSLSWPRNGVILTDTGYPIYEGRFAYGEFIVPNNVVPTLVAQCQAILALYAVDGPLAPVIERVITMEKLDILQTNYDPNSPAYTIFREVNMLLLPYLKSVSGTVALTRA